MMPRRSARSVSRKDTPLSPPKATPLAPNSDATHTKRATRSSSHEVTVAQQQLQNIPNDLQPVNEDLEAQDEDVPEPDEPEDALSLVSRSTGTESALNDLDRDAIIEFLGDLYDDSTKLISLFEGFDDHGLRAHLEKLLQPQSLQRRRFEGREKALLSSCEPYGNAHFIRVALIISKITGTRDLENLGAGSWRPDPILYIANLAVQLLKVFSLSETDRHDCLQYMFNNFPIPFAGTRHFTIGPDLIDSTVDLRIEILTQFFIHLATEEAGKTTIDPDQLAEGIFLGDNSIIQAFLDEAARRKNMHRLESIREHFSTDPDRSVDFDTLRQHFPWLEFLSRLVRWTLVRKDQLQAVIGSKGGLDRIMEELRAEDFFHNMGLMEASDPEADSGDVAGQEDALVDDAVEDSSLRRPFWKGPVTGKSLRLESDRLKELRQGWAARTSGVSSGRATDIQRTARESKEEIPQSPSPIEQGGNETEGLPEHIEEPAEIEEEPGHRAGRDDEFEQSVEVDEDLEQSADVHEEDEPPVNTHGRPGQRESADIAEERHDKPASERASTPPGEGVVPTQQTQIVMETLRRQQEQSEKENRQQGRVGNQTTTQPSKKRSLLDRQPNAEKVEWTEASDEPTPPPARPQKRARKENWPTQDDDEEEDEEDFQTDTRPAQVTRSSKVSGNHRPLATLNPIREQSVVEIDAQHARQPEKIRSSNPQQPIIRPSASQPVRSNTQPQPQKPRQPTRSSNPETRPPASTAPVRPRAAAPRSPPAALDYTRVNQEAKFKSMQYKMLKGPSVQTRRQYSEEETLRLIELIELCGTSYARILNEDLAHPDGPVLQNRDQKALKDKARNIKMDFLKYVAPVSYLIFGS